MKNDENFNMSIRMLKEFGARDNKVAGSNAGQEGGGFYAGQVARPGGFYAGQVARPGCPRDQTMILHAVLGTSHL